MDLAGEQSRAPRCAALEDTKRRVPTGFPLVAGFGPSQWPVFGVDYLRHRVALIARERGRPNFAFWSAVAGLGGSRGQSLPIERRTCGA